MHTAFSREDEEFRDEVLAFLDEKLNARLRDAGRLATSVYANREIMREWHQILYEKGWIAPSWPKEHGGCAWSVARRYIFATELARAGAPAVSPMGLAMCGPVLIGHGSPAQKAFYLPRILSGEDFWCQGYSEPGSGSDLASLTMSAVEDGEAFVCNGQKIWTTHAQYANRIFCLVRTAREEIPQKGITFLLIDMDSPGVRVDPLIMLSGEHVQNQVFFEDVRVPRENVVGEVGRGWTVAKYLLAFERGGGAYGPSLEARLRKLRRAARLEETGDAGRLIDDAAFTRKLAQAAIEIEAIIHYELRVMSALSRGEPPGAAASIIKTCGTEASQRLTELELEAAGVYAAPFQPHATCPGGDVPGAPPPANAGHVGPAWALTALPKYLNDRAGSIYGGSNEIQRNILAKVMLGG